MAQAGEKPSLPEWIDEKFVAMSLRKAECDDELQVESVDVAPPDPNGGGFHSEMLRVVARVRYSNGETSQRSLIVKTLGQSTANADAVRKGGMFLRETLCYTEMLPTLSSALDATEKSDWRPMAPNCYHSGSVPTKFLVLEDLLDAGFRVAENGKLLDQQHCSLVVRNIARLHAASLLLVGHESFVNPMFNIHPLYVEGAKDFFRTYTHKTFAALAENLQRHPGYEKYATKYRKLSVDIYDMVVDAVTSRKPVLKVLVHGDVWKNNIMFKYNGDHVTDVRIIDFQNCFWGPPAVDLQHFLYSSACEDVHRHHSGQLLSEYHCVLQATLRALRFREQAENFPLPQLLREMDELAIHGVCMSVVSPSIILAPENITEDVEEAVGSEVTNDAYFKRCTSSAKFLSLIKFLAPVFERKGVL